ncbi:MAG: hypothetical protein ACI841_001664 [Planctomycetota bacterium]|jgi:hypothetical protein
MVVCTLALFVWPTLWSHELQHRLFVHETEGARNLRWHPNKKHPGAGWFTCGDQVRHQRITGTEAIRVWLSVEDFLNGESQWMKNAEVVSGHDFRNAVSGLTLTKTSLKMAPDMQSRPVRKVWEKAIAREVAGARFGTIQAVVLDRGWDTLENGQEVQTMDGEQVGVISALAGGYVLLEITNRAEHETRLSDGFRLVAQDCVLVGGCHLMDKDGKKEDGGRVKAGETRRIRVQSTLIGRDELAPLDDFAIMNLEAGWVFDLPDMPSSQ